MKKVNNIKPGNERVARSVIAMGQLEMLECMDIIHMAPIEELQRIREDIACHRTEAVSELYLIKAEYAIARLNSKLRNMI